MTRIQATAWDYDNIPFRSKLEAKWYAAFQLMGWDVEYEPGPQKTEMGNYLPDFLVNRRKYVEVKPLLTEYPERDHESAWKAILLGYSTPTILIFGEPRQFIAIECIDCHKGLPWGFHLNQNFERCEDWWLYNYYPSEQKEKKFPFEEFTSAKLKNCNPQALDAEKKIQWRPKSR